MTYYWKVLRETPDSSRLISLFYKGRTTEYSRTERTYPEEGCGPLTILRTRKAAEHLFFHLRYKEEKVLAKVTAKISKHDKVWEGIEECSEESEMLARLRYSTIGELERANSDILLPGHTLLADWVKIVKIVQRKEVPMNY